MDVITRKEARERGLVRFYTGTPCKHGHDCERHAKSGTCVECGNEKSRKWNQSTEYGKRWRNDNPTYAASTSREWRRNNPDKVKAYNLTPGGRLISTINQIKRRSTKKGIECTITKADLVIPELCPVLGIPLDRSSNTRSDNSPSVDRIDNTKGYTVDNIRVISWRANRLKNDASIDEIEAILKYMTENEQATK